MKKISTATTLLILAAALAGCSTGGSTALGNPAPSQVDNISYAQGVNLPDGRAVNCMSLNVDGISVVDCDWATASTLETNSVTVGQGYFVGFTSKNQDGQTVSCVQGGGLDSVADCED